LKNEEFVKREQECEWLMLLIKELLFNNKKKMEWIFSYILKNMQKKPKKPKKIIINDGFMQIAK